MDGLTGQAHLRILGFKSDSAWGTTHMKHPDTQTIVYFDYRKRAWCESGVSFGTVPDELLRVLNHELTNS